MKQKNLAFLALVLLGSFHGCSTQPKHSQSRPDAYGSISTYAVPRGEGGANEMDYCFHYSKRVWELGNLIRENKLTFQQAREVIQSSLGKQGAAEDMSAINRLASGEYKTAEQMAGTRFFQCGRTLRLPIEDRHLAVAQSCFGLLKLPRYVNSARANGKSADEIKRALQETNSSVSHRLIETVVRDVFAAANDDQFNALNRKMFLSCIVARGSPGVR